MAPVPQFRPRPLPAIPAQVVAVTDGDTIKVIHAGQPERDFNHNANQKLVDAIREGYGGYWDILRRSVRAR